MNHMQSENYMIIAMLLLLSLLLVGMLVGVWRWHKSGVKQTEDGEFSVPRGSQNIAYAYTIGGDLGYTGRVYGMTIHVKVYLPNVVIDSHPNDKAARGLPFTPAKEQRLELEGDFYRSFSIYANPAVYLLALKLLMPDVMQVLVDYGKKFDLELRGNRIIIFSKGYIDHKVVRPELLAFAQKLMEQLDKQMNGLSSEEQLLASQNLLSRSDNESLPLKTKMFNVQTVAVLIFCITIPLIIKLLLSIGNVTISWLSLGAFAGLLFVLVMWMIASISKKK